MPVDPKVRYAFRNVVITLEDIQEKLAEDSLTIVDNDDLWRSEQARRSLEARVAELATESSANETGYTRQYVKTDAWETEAKAWKARTEHVTLRLRTAHERIEELQAESLKDVDELTRLSAALEAAEARIRALEHELEGCSHVQPAECLAQLQAAQARIAELEASRS